MKQSERDYDKTSAYAPNSGCDPLGKREQYRALDEDGRPIPVSVQKESVQDTSVESGMKTKKQKRWPVLITVAMALVVALMLCVGLGLAAKPWETNILRHDSIEDLNGDGDKNEADAFVSSVFGSEYKREQISSITVLDTVKGAPVDAWDVSEANDGAVMAWVVPNGELYDLYLAGDGGISAGPDASTLFAGYKNASSITLGDAFHTEGTRTMRSMFYHCESLVVLEVSDLDTSNVTDLSRLFFGCKALETLDISKFDTTNVTDMSRMFRDCEALNDLTLGELNTYKVESMRNMFYGCIKLETLDISKFDTSNVTDMGNLFYHCEALNDLTLGELNTSKVEDMESMFDTCKALETLDISNFDTSNVTDMGWMFYHCEALEDIKLGEFDTSKVENMKSMFNGCFALETLNLSSFDTSNVTDMSYMFKDCGNLTNLIRGEKFVTDNADTTQMMYGVGEAKRDPNPWKKNILRNYTCNDVDGDGTYTVEELSKSSVFGSDHTRDQILSITILDTLKDAPENAWDVSESGNGTVLAWLAPNGELYDLYIAGEGGVSSGKYSRFLFAGYINAVSIEFNNDFHTDQTKDMCGMFYGCKAVETLDLNSFETPNATDMSWMFDHCIKLSNLTVDKFNTSNVENMHQMFNGCESLETLKLDTFNTAKVTNMRHMFGYCTKLQDLTLGDGFVVTGETDAAYMFKECPADHKLWEANVLKYFDANDNDGSGTHNMDEVTTSSVFGSAYQRNQIRSITILDSLKDAPTDAWDVAQSGTIKAWVKPNGELYDLYLAANCGMDAGQSGYVLFAGYTNAVSIDFGNAFHTDHIESMVAMFWGCKSLEKLVLSSFDTSSVQFMGWMFTDCEKLQTLELDHFDTTKVQSMVNMFGGCKNIKTLVLSGFKTSNVTDMKLMFNLCTNLEKLELENFDTEKVQNMQRMFDYCAKLKELDLSSFDTAGVTDMSKMFSGCTSLASLTLSDKFVTTNADTTNMFDNCPAGAEYQHLLK